MRRSGVLVVALALGACGVKAAPRPAASAGTAPAEAAPPAGGAPAPSTTAPGAGTGGR